MHQQQVNVPLIGQQNDMLGQLRLNIALQILPQLALADYNTQYRRALDKDESMGGNGDELEFGMNCGLVANAAMAYADALLIAAGVAKKVT